MQAAARLAVQASAIALGAVLGASEGRADTREVALAVSASERTLQQMRTVGMAMWQWIIDHDGLYSRPPTRPAGGDWYLDAEELAAILVPGYLDEVPRVDGWGHPYEYLLLADAPVESGNTTAHAVIRSPGRDGKYSVEHYYDYEQATFDALDLDQDVVWIDWRFRRMPRRD